MSDPAEEIRQVLARLRATTDEPFPEVPEPAPFYSPREQARAVGAAVASAKTAPIKASEVLLNPSDVYPTRQRRD
jgi:hypothetical protein